MNEHKLNLALLCSNDIHNKVRKAHRKAHTAGSEVLSTDAKPIRAGLPQLEKHIIHFPYLIGVFLESPGKLC